jgi:hypothetical protein
MAAGRETWLNPALDLPYYFLAIRLIPAWPRLVAFLAGIPVGLLTIVTLRLARAVLPERIQYRNVLAIVTAAIGLTGTFTISEIGTTYGDIPVSVLLLAAPGLAMAAGGVRQFFVTGIVFSFGWTQGFAIAFGPRGIFVAGMFENPIFPLLNQIFRSPWAPPVSAIDMRFFPRNVWQAMFYPFLWLRGDSFVAAEIGVRDPRYALAYLSIAVLAVQAIRRRLVVNRAAVALCVFFIIVHRLGADVLLPPLCHRDRGPDRRSDDVGGAYAGAAASGARRAPRRDDGRSRRGFRRFVAARLGTSTQLRLQRV